MIRGREDYVDSRQYNPQFPYFGGGLLVFHHGGNR